MKVDAPPPPSAPRLERVRSSDRRSRLAVAGLAVLLMGVLAVGLLGRPGASPTAPVVAIAPTESAISLPSESSPPDPRPSAWPAANGPATEPAAAPPATATTPPATANQVPRVRLGGGGARGDAYAVFVPIDGRMYMSILDEVERGRFLGTIVVSYPVDVRAATLVTLAQLWAHAPRPRGYVVLGTWPLDLMLFSDSAPQSESLLSVEASAQRSGRLRPRASQHGYTLSVGGSSHASYGLITVDVQLGNARPATTSADSEAIR